MSDCRADCYVYAHSRLNGSGAFYIGKGRGYRATSRNSRNRHWRHIVTKDGGFKTSFLIRDVDYELATLAEIEAIDVYRRRGISLVNMTSGGEGTPGLRNMEHLRRLASLNKGRVPWNKGVPATEDHRRKLSQRLVGNTYRRGKPTSDETRRRQAIAQTGRKHSPETLAKMRESGLRRGVSDELKAKMLANRKFGPLSEETKRKMSAVRKGRPAINRGVPHGDAARAKMRAAQLARWARLKVEKNMELELA